ncbi:MAG: hypothetical protein ASARMPRED_006741 [Alectoria sarmentosa]|nr:MAG: hypothetical protein ASARMPRED_006741 [Alectoria sarmentosa]
MRWLSDDGECAIDLTLKPGKQNFDDSSGDEIAKLAQDVYEKCVESQERGGYLKDFNHGPLLVDMRTTGDVTRASWWDIWSAGVAVNTLCIQNGLTGTSSDLESMEFSTYWLF